MEQDPVKPRLIVASAALFEAKETLAVFESRGIPVTFIEVGVGAIRSAQITSRLADLVTGRPVLFLGSCGTSNSFHHPTLITGRTVHWAPADVRFGESYLIPGVEPQIELSPLSVNFLKECAVSCSASITSRVEKNPDVYENLELYSTASAWRHRTAQFWSVLGITNQLGPHAHADWKKHFRDVAHLTAKFVEEHLQLFV